MLKIYYKLWASAINHFRSQEKFSSDWKIWSVMAVSMFMGINLSFIKYIIETWILHTNYYNVTIIIFSHERFNDAVSFFVLYMIIPIMVNYFLIFYKKKHEKIVAVYSLPNKSKVFRIYGIGTFLICFGIPMLRFFFK